MGSELNHNERVIEMNPLKKAILESRKRAEAARIEFYHAELNLCRVKGARMPQAHDRYAYVVFHDNGDLLYDGTNQTVARLVASCFKVGVY